ncbi:hypothetical protein HWV62_30013 [Athelia sp. TMB]|nr:hypothetical protein HWV62_30013 [Athelia sp. TMB]
MTLPEFSRRSPFGPEDLTGRVKKTAKYCFANGSLADIWLGELQKKDGTTQIVAVKVIRSVWDQECLERLNTKLIREALVWSRLEHPNITPFYGISFDLGVRSAPCLVSPYYINGTLSKYLESNTEINKIALICQIASGLAYLHQNDVVHGDIKSSNILINDEREASISDFGLSRLLQYTGFTTKVVGGTYRWMAFELVNPENDEEEEPAITTATDVWAFAMTVLEILSGKLPFYWMKYDAAVILHVMRGGRPTPDHYPSINQDMWAILKMCWHPDPDQRPNMDSLHHYFNSLRLGPVQVPVAELEHSLEHILYSQPWC